MSELGLLTFIKNIQGVGSEVIIVVLPVTCTDPPFPRGRPFGNFISKNGIVSPYLGNGEKYVWDIIDKNHLYWPLEFGTNRRGGKSFFWI